METGAVGVFTEMVHGDIIGSADGMKLDSLGNLYVSGGKEGVWVISPEADVLGFISTGEQAINLAWGDDDWHALYIVSRTSLYRVRMKVPGQQLNPQ
jgi:gluconolactonase